MHNGGPRVLTETLTIQLAMFLSIVHPPLKGRHGARTGTSSEQATNARLEDSSSQHRTG